MSKTKSQPKYKTAVEQKRLNLIFDSIEHKKPMPKFGTFVRGEIYYIYDDVVTIGSEQTGGRPAVIVSDNALNRTSSVLEVLFLTTAPKKDLPTHARIYATGRPSTVIAEQITSISIDRIGNQLGTCSPEELDRIDEALAHSIGIHAKICKKDTKKETEEKTEQPSRNEAQYLELENRIKELEDLHNTTLNALQKKELELTETKISLSVQEKMYYQLLDKLLVGAR